jgi:hypothetical protein
MKIKDPRIVLAWKKSVSSFNEAAKLFPHYFELIGIPYEGTIIPEYFFAPFEIADGGDTTKGFKVILVKMNPHQS